VKHRSAPELKAAWWWNGEWFPADSGRPTDFFRSQSAGLPESAGVLL